MPRNIEKGDLLFYYKKKNFLIFGNLIKFGEFLEDGRQEKTYFHVAIALDDKTLLEADGKTVTKNPIDYEDGFDVYRVSLPKLDDAIQYALSLEGEKYDWTLIIDDGLKYLTHGFIHLPEEMIDKLEKHMKICSTLAEVYLEQGGFTGKIRDEASPEDVYLPIKQYIVV